MLQSPQFEIAFAVFGVVWVGGWGFVMFRYPEFFAKLNARFGYHTFASPKYVSFIRKLGLAEMVLAALFIILMSMRAALGLRWF